VGGGTLAAPSLRPLATAQGRTPRSKEIRANPTTPTRASSDVDWGMTVTRTNE